MIFFTDSELGRAGRRQSQVRQPEMSTVDSSFYVKTALPARSKYVTMLIPRRGDDGQIHKINHGMFFWHKVFQPIGVKGTLIWKKFMIMDLS